MVLQHENQHVAINRAVLRAYAPRIAAELRGAVHRMFPMLSAQREDTQRLPGFLMDAVRPIVGQMLAELR